MLSTQEVNRRYQCDTDMEILHVHIHMEKWRHFIQIRHGDTQRHVETHGDMWRHTETHGDMWRHMETHRDVWRHTETHRDTPYKICSQIKTDIYDAISSLALIGPMS